MPKIEIKYEFTILGIIQIVLLVVGGTFAYATLVNAQAQAAIEISQLRPAVGALEEFSATLNTRMTVVESRAETSDKNYEKLAMVVGQVAEKLTGVADDAKSANRGIEYVREWIKDIKQAEKVAQP